MARTDYGAILSTVIKDTSDSVRLRENTEALFAPSDWSNEIKKMEMMKVATATAGSIVTFNDGVEQAPFVSLKTAITPVQAGSGDPSPSNSRPISGWDSVKVSATGKNLCEPLSVETSETVGNSYRVQRNAIPSQRCVISFLDKDTTVDISSISFGFVDSKYVGASALKSSEYRWLILNGVIQNEKRNIPTNLDDSISLDGFIAYPKSTATWEALMARFYIQVELGSTATTYEPYNGQTATIALPHTVYGAEHDVDSGKLKITHKYQDLGDISWTPYNGTFYAQLENAKTPSSIGTVADIICSQYKADTLNHVLGKTTDGIIAINDQQSRVHIYDSSKSSMTGADFKTAMSGVQLVYELATPIEIDLTPAQLQARNGVNNVWADAGEISECKYYTHNSGGVTVSELNHGTYVASGVNDANIETGTPYGIATYSSLGKGNVIIDFTASTDTHSDEGRVLIYKNDTLVNTYTLYNSLTNNYSAIISVDEGDTVAIKVGWIGSHSDCIFNVYTDTYNIVEG